jgi:hypothetical protein
MNLLVQIGSLLLITFATCDCCFADNSVAELVYIPSTGQVILEGECAAGGVITNFVLESNGQFINTNDIVNPYGSAFFTANADEISASDGNAVGLSVINLGNALPPNLTLSDLQTIFSRATYVGELGSGEFDFAFRVEMASVEVIVNEGELQRSMVQEIEVVFTGDVQIGGSAFSLAMRGGSNVAVSFSTAVANGKTIATLSFFGANTESSGSLVDGNYELSINGGDIVDSLGNNFDVDEDGTAGGTAIFGDEEQDFMYRLFGDIERNRTVNIFDLLGFRQTCLLMTGDASFNAGFDSIVDGRINIFDLLRFRQNYRKTLTF